MIHAVLLILLLAPGAFAQSAGAAARVAVDELPVYAKMNTDAKPLKMLFKGETVIIGLVLFGDDITWCAVNRPGENRRMGYVACESLEPDRGEASPPPPKPPVEPVRIREIPSAPVKVRELTREAADELVRNARATGALPDPASLKLPEPAPLPPAPKPVERPANVPAFLLDRSGVTRDLELYIQRTNLVSFLDRTRLAKIDAAKLRQTIASHFNAQAFEKELIGKLQQNYDPVRMPLLLAWLQTPAAERYQAAMASASRPEARPELVEFASKMTKNPPSAERLRRIHRLYAAHGNTEREVRTTLSLVRAAAGAMNPQLPKSLRFDTIALEQSLMAVQASYLPVMKNARIVHLLFALREMPEAELEACAAFWESDAGKGFAATLDTGFASAAASIGKQLLNQP